MSTETAFNIGHTIGKKIYSNILHLEYIEHVEYQTSEIINAVTTKTNNVVNGILIPILLIFSSILIGLSIVIVLLIVDPEIALLVLFGFVSLYIPIIIFTKRKLTKDGKIIAKNSTKLIESLQNGIGFVRDVILEQSQDIHLAVFSKADKKMRQAQSDYMFIGQAPRYIVEGLGICLIVLIVNYNLTNDSKNSASILTLIGVLALSAQRMLPLLQTIYSSITFLRSNAAMLDDVVDLLKISKDYKIKLKNNSKIKFDKTLKFKNVSYKYPKGDKYVLQNINFEIRKGQKIALIGPSGEGKSTIADLIMGLLLPTKGKIYVDESALLEENCKSWHRQISHVPQNIFLINDTVEKNIVFNFTSPRLFKSRLKLAIAKSNLKKVLNSLEKKSNIKIGENGILLSGGQRQRIGIARAIYKNSSIIVLDEATSALDFKTKHLIINNLLNMNKTIIFISHDLESAKKFDVILEVKNSKVIKHE